MKTQFIESGMTFEFDDENIYRIEKSQVVRNLQSVKSCECVVRNGEFLDIFEAKTNAPNPNNKNNLENIEKFNKDIEQKFTDTLLFISSISSKRNIDNACPPSIKGVSLSSIKYRFYIIINELDIHYLPEQTSIFKKVLKHVIKAWKIDDSCIKVLSNM